MYFSRLNVQYTTYTVHVHVAPQHAAKTPLTHVCMNVHIRANITNKQITQESFSTCNAVVPTGTNPLLSSARLFELLVVGSLRVEGARGIQHCTKGKMQRDIAKYGHKTHMHENIAHVHVRTVHVYKELTDITGLRVLHVHVLLTVTVHTILTVERL